MPRFSPSGFFRPSRCLVPTPGLTSSTPCAVSECVCACACTHTYKHIYSHAHQKNREDTDNTPKSPSVKNKPQRQAASALYRLAEPPHPRPPPLMNKLRIYERTELHVHALWRVCLQIRKLMSKSISLLYITTHDLVLKTLVEYMPNSTQKMHLHSRKHARATV